MNTDLRIHVTYFFLQIYGIYPVLTVIQNILFFLNRYKIKEPVIQLAFFSVLVIFVYERNMTKQSKSKSTFCTS